MKTGFLRSRGFAAVAGAVVAALTLSVTRLLADEPSRPATAKQVFTEALPHVPGKRLTVIQVNYAPGGKSASHAHAGSVFAYVLSGKIRSENSATGPAKVYETGEGFWEPPGSVHTVSENASATEPASLLAIFIADEGATLTRSAPGG
jgi:quercetin dioxygenase-like cupin family protein